MFYFLGDECYHMVAGVVFFGQNISTRRGCSAEGATPTWLESHWCATTWLVFLFTIHRVKTISYGKPVLKTENGDFNAFAVVFDPENGRIGPCFSWSPTGYFGRGIQRRFAISPLYHLENCWHSPVSSKSVSHAIYSKNSPHFRMKYRSLAGTIFLVFFLRSGNIVKKSKDSPGENKNGSRYLSPKDREYSEQSEPNSVRLRV